ncbi:hypothetical protein [Cerasicoccus maritimus]|uniref:hypothetical protein n=1 Tax=Cerasicoccus maritimus TaxID=490089 RepID=UPI002852A7CC|nr:hypothetical protein [Cerasicoccus maritimus]
MDIPNKWDWGYGRNDIALDEERAMEHFYGRSLERAEELFAENAHIYKEDLMWMPVKPFQFYIMAFINYLKSERSQNDSGAASAFISLIDFKLENESRFLIEVWEAVSDALSYIRERQCWYDADLDIYGDFTMKVDAVLASAKKKRRFKRKI